MAWTLVATVREWHDVQGWGVLEAPELPGGCWCHFSAVQGSGFRALPAGAEVDAEVEVVEEDGYTFRAVSVRRRLAQQHVEHGND